MLKKILIVIVSLLSLSYIVYLCYQYTDRHQTVNNLMKIKGTLVKENEDISKKIESLEETNVNLTNEKEVVNTQIKEKEVILKQVNDEITTVQEQIRKKRVIQTKKMINTGPKVAYLTFDDGPSSYTNRVLDILKDYGIKATFFVNGRGDANSHNIYRRIVNEGHSIGNHTYSHNYQTVYSSITGYDNNFNMLQNLILNVTNVTMDIMRFPGGSNNTVSNNYQKGIMDSLTNRYRELGYSYYDWNVSAGDTGVGATTTSVINNVTNGCYNKTFAIILMHDSLPTTPSALPTIIQNLTNMGFSFQPIVSSTPAIQFK